MDVQKIFKRRDTRIYCLTALIALMVRAILYLDWLHSPMRYLHRVHGLDMMTLLQFAEWGESGTILFAPHRMLLALFWKLNGEVHPVELLVLLQTLGGVAIALLTVYAALRLWRNHLAALAAGLIAALYAPAVMYELSMLQETLALLTFSASFAGILWAHKHHFRLRYAATAGILLGIASIGRPTALLWVLFAAVWSAFVLWRRGRAKRVWPLIGGVLCVWLLISALNWYFAAYPGPFYHVLSYSASVNPAPAAGGEVIAPISDSSVAKLFRIGANALSRLPKVFLAHEIPDNMNYYFIRAYNPGFQFLIGPGLLIPFALSGLVLTLLSRRFLRRDGLILLAMFALALPICANYPVGRYRLILLLPFALLAVQTLRIAWTLPHRVWLPISAAVLLGAFLINQPFSERHTLRSSDFVSWALAQEQPSGQVNEASLATLTEGYYRSGGNEAVTINLLIRLISLRQLEAAEELIAGALQQGGTNPSLLFYYGAMMKLERGDAPAAEVLLEQVDPDRLDDLRIKYYFLRGDAARLQDDLVEARRMYEQALNEPDPFGFRPMVEHALRRLDALLPATVSGEK